VGALQAEQANFSFATFCLLCVVWAGWSDLGCWWSFHGCEAEDVCSSPPRLGAKSKAEQSLATYVLKDDG
jgi:hypothetical protein